MYPHRIRLRGPWCYVPLAGTLRTAAGEQRHVSEKALPSGVMKLPCRWRDGGLGEFSGKVRFTRHFASPERLDAHERVWLTVEGVTGSYEIELNGKFVGYRAAGEERAEFAVTDLLHPRNTLNISIDAGADGGIWGKVALEIRASAWLEQVAVDSWSEGDAGFARVRGNIKGEAAGQLDLYAILGRYTVAQASATAGGEFELVSEALPPDRWRGAQTIRIELMNGASAWYTLEAPVGFEAHGKTP
jgi:hypothetical protein